MGIYRRSVPEPLHRLVLLGLGIVLLATSAAAICDQSEQMKRQNAAADGTPEAGRRPASGEVAIFDLRDGDCIADEMGVSPTAVGRVHAVSCRSAEAKYRVSRTFTIGADGDPYPGDAYIEKHARRCGAAVIWPSEDAWEEGGRTIICFSRE